MCFLRSFVLSLIAASFVSRLAEAVRFTKSEDNPLPKYLAGGGWKPADGGSWLTDGSNFTFYTKEPHQHAISTDDSTGVVNALLTGLGGMQQGVHAWRFHFSFDSDEPRHFAGGYAVGLSDPDHLGESYGTEGLFFNGVNLASGGALLKARYANPNFHPLTSTDTVDLFVEISAPDANHHKLDVWFVHNGVSLGKAFQLPAVVGCPPNSSLSAAPLPLYPAISFHSTQMTATVEKMDQCPLYESLAREDPTLGTLAGKWVSLSPLVSDLDIIGECDKRVVELNISTKVWNIMGTHVQCTADVAGHTVDPTNPKNPDTSKTDVSFAGQVWTCVGMTGVRSTMMMPPPKDREREEKVSEFLSSLKEPKKFRLEKGGKTLFVDNVEFVRDHDLFEPVRESPFHCVTAISE